MAMTPEGKVKKLVKAVVAKYPEIYPYWPVPGGFGSPTLDCILCVKGKFVAIETKAPGKKPTPLQKSTIAEMQKAGAVVLVIDGPDGVYTLEKVLAEIYDPGSHLR